MTDICCAITATWVQEKGEGGEGKLLTLLTLGIKSACHDFLLSGCCLRKRERRGVDELVSELASELR